MFEPIEVKFATEQWTIGVLVKLFEHKQLNLSPRYQRNDIWSLTAQRRLIETVQRGYPMPNFFVRRRPRDRFEMVDGQQRARTLIGYWNGDFADKSKLTLTKEVKANPDFAVAIKSFSSYMLAICILDSSLSDAEVENFYVIVNSTGMRLNKPELRKAEYYDTRFLRLSTDVANHPHFGDLDLFSTQSEERMNDIEFASELLTFLKCGFTDKKEQVEQLYESDIPEHECETLKERAIATLAKIVALNDEVPLRDTRFRQKADFYTLFAFVSRNRDIGVELLKYCYQILLRLAPHIRPSQEECEPLFTYAINCVSQSHLKKAREARNALFEALFLNRSDFPNATQRAIADYFEFGNEGFVKLSGSLLFRIECLE